MTIDIVTLENLLSERKVKEAKSLLKSADKALIAVLLDQARGEYKSKIFLLLDDDVASDVILDVSDYTRQEILSHLTKGKITKLVEEMESDESTDLLTSLPRRLVKQILKYLTKKERTSIEKLLTYGEDTAGGLMKVEKVLIREDTLVGEAIEQIRKQNVENLHNVFVVDKKGRIKGVLPLRNLIIAKNNTKVSKIMDRKVVTANVSMDVEQVARLFKQYDLYSMPVVDSTNRIVGRITADDVMDVIEDEAEEDLYKLSGIGADERVYDPIQKAIRGRMPWLVVNLFTALLAALTVSLFEGTIQKLVLLAVFMPVVAGMGGNAGTQTLTVIIRGIALGHLNKKGMKRVILKELSLGLLNGILIGAITSIIAYLWKGKPLIGFVIFLAMVINLLVAGTVGTLIPIILKKLNIDPAVASSVIVTTFTDVIGFASFLGIATILLSATTI
ncbi:MAG: magnesium transporter [Candidatus Diapherotrites archaeon]|nr:magnesium transporter [Candidatus Diapherotrites archaeon]